MFSLQTLEKTGQSETVIVFFSYKENYSAIQTDATVEIQLM